MRRPCAALLIMFFLGYYDMKAGGALGALAVGLIASNAWEKGFPRFASLGPSLEYSPASERGGAGAGRGLGPGWGWREGRGGAGWGVGALPFVLL